jgi:hypothetical protein
MIVVRVELWPQGSFRARKTIAVATIANVGGTETRGEYEAKFYGAGNGASGDIEHVYGHLTQGRHLQRTPWRVAFLRGFARKREGAWHLLRYLLTEAIAHAPIPPSRRDVASQGDR